MFRVVKEESLNIYTWIGMKLDLIKLISLISIDTLTVEKLSSIRLKQPFKP